MKPVGQGHSTKEETDTLWGAVRKVPHFYYQLNTFLIPALHTL
ncbi:MAG: hypothetical protein PUA69_02545 [Erysipelotrichaceae bacterium]|nr:hypothetical protein [Erysipelotrichaceae bacterium]